MNQTLQRLALDSTLAVLIFAVAVGCACVLDLLLNWLGGYFKLAANPATSKLAPLEGLRGVLAISVAAHHACCWYFFSQSGIWSTGGSVIFARLAGFGVMQFFFISGFLFWRKSIKQGKIPLCNFYLSRLVRITPTYYVCIAIALLIGLVSNGLQLQVSWGALLASLLPWLLFTLSGMPSVNNVDLTRITCGVTWTLALEWTFYLSLPLLGWFCRKTIRLFHYAFLFGALYLAGWYLRLPVVHLEHLQNTGFFIDGFAKFMLIGFGGGILIAQLELRLQSWLRFLLPWRNWMLLGLYITYLCSPGMLVLDEVLLLTGFTLVVQGADIFGFLASRPVRLLGRISYPVYLVHGLVYYVAMKLRGGTYAVEIYSYSVETAVCLAVILLLATMIHLSIEQPSIKLSESFARRAWSSN